MRPEELVEKLRAALPEGIRSVILYGSAAAGDRAEGVSDYNVLVVTDRLGIHELHEISKPCAAWIAAGNPPPMLFTSEQLERSADVFPIEILDMQQSRRLLYGEDAVARIRVAPGNLRHQLEYEMKARLIRLRQQYLATDRDRKRIVQALTGSLSSFLVLLRAALRLFRADVPAKKIDAVDALAEHIAFDTGVFRTVEALKRGELPAREINGDALFDRYLRALEDIADAVDRHMAKKEGATT